MGRLSFTRIVVAASVLLLAAACGSAGSGSTASGSAGGGQSAGKASTIVIGNIGTNSGPESSTTATGLPVLVSWVNGINAAGGINGHMLKLVSFDDGLNPATALQDAKVLVDQDHVAAIVGEQSLLDSEWASIPAAAGVPVIGGMPYETPLETPMFSSTKERSLSLYRYPVRSASERNTDIDIPNGRRPYA